MNAGCLLCGVACALAATSAIAAAPDKSTVDLPADCVSAFAQPTLKAAEVEARFDDLRRESAIDAMAEACRVLPQALSESGSRFEAAKWRLLVASTLVVQARTDEAKTLLDHVRVELEALPGDQRQWLAEAAYWEGFRKFVVGTKADAAKDFNHGKELLDSAGRQNQLLYARMLIGLGNSARAGQEFALARESLLQAQRRLRALGLGESMDMTDVFNALMRTAGQQQDYATAKKHAMAEVALTKKLRGPLEPELRYGLASLGVIHINLQEYDRAERVLREAMTISDAAKVSDFKAEMLVLTDLAGLLTERGNPREALGLAQRAIAIGEQALGPDSVRLVGAVLEVGAAQEALGNYPAARRASARALDLIAKNEANVISAVHARALRQAAELDLRLGDLDGALPYASALDELARKDGKLPVERAQAARFSAEIEAKRGSVDEALRDLRRSAEYLSGVFAKGHPTFLEIAAAACALQARGQAAPSQCEDTQLRFSRGGEMSPRVRESALLSMARWKERRGEETGALQLRIRALATAESMGAPDLLWAAHDAVAGTLYQRGDKSLAIFFGKQAIAALESIRANFHGEDERYDGIFLADKIGVYRRVADWLMEAGRFDEAIEVIRLLKLEEYFDFVQRDGGARSEGVPLSTDEQALAAAYAKVRDPRRRVGADYDRLSRLDQNDRATGGEKARLTQLSRRQAKLERELAAEIDTFVAEHTHLVRSARGGAGQMPGANRDLDPQRVAGDTAVGIYLFGDTRVRLLVITRGARVMRDIPLPPAELSLRIGRFLAALEARENVDAQARELYALIARPLDELARQAGAKRLVLWLDGPLRYLPFAALQAGDGYLIDHYALQVYSSIVGGKGEHSTEHQASVRAFALTRAVQGRAALPAMADEVCAIVRGPVLGSTAPALPCLVDGTARGALAGEGYLDEQFSEGRLRRTLDDAREFSYLHLATHFSLRPGNVNRSYLLLGDGSHLSLEQIWAMRFGGLDLVTLSACETGLGGGGGDGREVEGLGAVIQGNGARRVLASLWRVEDTSTSLLMQRLYRKLAAKEEAGEALRQAQLAVRDNGDPGTRRYAHPYYWAGFVLSAAER